MALVTTTLGAACAAVDTFLTVASATTVAANRLVRVDDEWMRVRSDYVNGTHTTTVYVIRGLQGSVVAAHPVTANVTHGNAEDFDNSPDQSAKGVIAPGFRTRKVLSYTAAGAITLPQAGEDMVAVLNGTVALAMTIANPAKDADSSILIVVGNGKAAHTLTYTAGLGDGGSGLDVATFDVGAQCAEMFIAANGIWVPLPSPRSGTLTGADVAYA